MEQSSLDKGEDDRCGRERGYDSDDDSAGLIRERIRLVVQAILDLYQNDKKDNGRNVLNEIDIVIAHSSRGIFRINGDRLQNILGDDNT
jgi:hypothetical protein